MGDVENGDVSRNPLLESLDDECRGCGKSWKEVNEVVPVTHGHWLFGPEWSCGDCADSAESEDAEVQQSSDCDE